MTQWLTENEIALYSNLPKYFVEKTPPKLPNASISVESKDGEIFRNNLGLHTGTILKDSRRIHVVGKGSWKKQEIGTI